MGKKIKGVQFTTRYWLQGKIRSFIKELDYSIEGVSGFDQLDQKSKDSLLEWKKILLRDMKTKLAACYEEIVGDMTCDDAAIFRMQVNTERLKPSE